MRNQRFLLPVIVILALTLRIIALGERNFWYDEAFSAIFAQQGIPAMVESTIVPDETTQAPEIHPLLYYITLNGWMAVFGTSAFAVRLWSAVIGAATVYAVFLATRELFDQRTGMIAALITAIAPFHIQYSQEARMYALMGLLLVLATWAFIRAYRSSETRIAWRWWIGFGIFAGLAMHTQQLSAFYLAALGVIPFAARSRARIFGTIAGTITALFLYLPWILVAFAQFQRVTSNYWIPVPNAARLLLTLRSLLIVNLDIPAPGSLIGLAIALLLLIFLIVQVLIRRKRQSVSERAALYFALWMFAAPILGLWAFSQVRPLYIDRALIGSALMLYIAFAWLITKAKLPRPILIGIVALIFAASAIGLSTHYSWAIFPNSPYRQAVSTIWSQYQISDVVIHQDKTSALPSMFYAPEMDQRYLRDEPGAADDTLSLTAQRTLGAVAVECVQQAASRADRVWWVTFSFTADQYAAAGVNTYQQAIDWLDANFATAFTYHYNDLDVTLYYNRTTDPTQGECAP